MGALVLAEEVYNKWKNDDNLCLKDGGETLITKKERLDKIKQELINELMYDPDITDEEVEETIQNELYEYPQSYEEFFRDLYDLNSFIYTTKSGDRIKVISYTEY